MHGEPGSEMRPRSAAQGRQHARLQLRGCGHRGTYQARRTPVPRSFPKPGLDLLRYVVDLAAGRAVMSTFATTILRCIRGMNHKDDVIHTVNALTV